jgi:SAM-dependent methyltransferase
MDKIMKKILKKLAFPLTKMQNHFRLKKDLKILEKQAKKSPVKFPVTKLFPCYKDKCDNAGILPQHYFFQDLYVAQRIYQNNPKKHIDIGSRIDGFVAHVASYRKIEIYDIRPMKISIPNVNFTQADLMNLSEKDYECTDSISCLHAIEHFGLGRYGDDICFDGYLLGFQNIYKMLQKGGKFYFSVPMGHQRIEFHAHRVFSMQYLLDMINPYYTIDSFSYVDDKNCFYENVNISEENLLNNFNCWYGCAVFELTKK